MEPISLILAALGAGAIAATKETAQTAVKNAYQGLKTLIKKKFAEQGKEDDSDIVDKHEKKLDSEAFKALLKEELINLGVDKDTEIIKLAQELLKQEKPEESAWQERLRSAKGQWEATKQDSGSLLRGAALAEAEEQLKERPEDLIDEQEFIEQSIQEGNRLQQVEVASRKREIRTAWGIAAGSLVAVMISGGLALTAWNQTKQSELNGAESLARYSLLLFNEHKELEAFVTAIKAGKIFGKHNTTNPQQLNALQTVLTQGKERNRLEGHQGYVFSVSFSPDGKTIATASNDNTARLWNLQGQRLHEFKGHQGYVSSVSFSPDGKTIATASLDNTARLWNLQGQLLQEFKGHQGWVTSVSFSPDGKTIATASYDNTARLWNLQGQLLQEFKGHQGEVWGVSFSRDGKTIATASWDKTARLWNLQGQLLQEFKGHQDDVTSVSFSPDGKTIATASGDGTIKLWDMDFDSLMRRSCDVVRDYLTYNPLKNNPDVSESDRHLCDGIGTRK